MNGVIWSKTQKTFVPISSVPIFARMQQERFKQNRALETYNFQLQNLTVTYFQERNYFEFYDNDTKVTGILGDLWTFLSEKLNFTLQPVRSNIISLGASEKNYTVFARGLLGIISRHETFAIPKVEIFDVRHIATDYTIPLWMKRERLYIQHEIIHDITWMTKVFSWKIWCFILMMYLLLSICSFWSQTILSRIGNNCRRSTINDHIFYNFGLICNQSYIPDILLGRSRILEISLGLFCSILSMAFGALLFVHITKRMNIIPPFYDLDSLLTDSSYKVVTIKDSIGDIAFQINPDKSYRRIKTAKRFVAVSTLDEMFKLACLKGKKKYAIFQSDHEYKIRNEIGCHVIPNGKSVLRMWVASGIKKNFKYKRTIDLGILKLKETGLWDMLTKRWFVGTNRWDIDNTEAEAIEISQVFLIILMLCNGIIIAFIIFIIEKIVYAYQHKL